MKKIILQLYYSLEWAKMLIFGKIFGLHYVMNTLLYSRKNHIEKILKYYGAHVGRDNHFKGFFMVDNHNISNNSEAFKNIIIGDNCYIGKNVFFDLANEIIIGDDVVVSANVTIMTHADVGERSFKKYYTRVCEPVHIGKGTWIGANVTILAGVHIGEHCVIAAGSVVKEDVMNFSMVAGVPAKFKKDIK